MTPRDISCRDALPCMNMALKLAWYFYLLMEKPRGHYFQARSPYYQAAQCNQKTPIPICSRWQVWSEKAKKGYASTLITTALISMASSKMELELQNMDSIFLKLSIHFKNGKTQHIKAINSYFCHNPGSSGNTRTMYDTVLVSLLLASPKIHISFWCFHCWLWTRKYRLEWFNSLTTYLI